MGSHLGLQLVPRFWVTAISLEHNDSDVVAVAAVTAIRDVGRWWNIGSIRPAGRPRLDNHGDGIVEAPGKSACDSRGGQEDLLVRCL